MMDVDQDSFPDISHGDLVSTIVKINGAKAVALDGGVDSIKAIPKDTKVINISISIYLSFHELSKRIGLEVTSDNVKSLSAKVLDRLEALPNNEPDFPGNIANTVKNVRRLEALARSGTIPVVAAGNMGRDYLNLLTLGTGTVVVGGLDSHGEKHPASGDNSLVTEWRPISIQPQIVNGGMSLLDNNETHLRWTKTTSKGKYLELASVPDEFLEKVQQACEQETLRKLAKQYQSLDLKTGIYRPADLMFGADLVTEVSTENLIPSSKYSNKDYYVAFEEGANPKIWIITGKRMQTTPAHAVKVVPPELTVQINDQSKNASLSEKELTQVLVKAGLKEGHYDLIAIKHALENNSNNHYIRIKLAHNALILKQNRSTFVNIRGKKPNPIEGTSFATPVVAAELAKGEN